VTAFESAQYMAARLLRDADWAGMAHGLEIRTPFADAALYRALAPLLASAEPPVKDDLVAGDARLPAAVAERPKTGFVVPVDRWIAPADGGQERGLRVWARTVYRAAAGGSSQLLA
jgi:asparagine synthase (glutamine-hydrolysing)